MGGGGSWDDGSTQCPTRDGPRPHTSDIAAAAAIASAADAQSDAAAAPDEPPTLGTAPSVTVTVTTCTMENCAAGDAAGEGGGVKEAVVVGGVG